jgi:multicomponent Na+:H+ antiporter subunit D
MLDAFAGLNPAYPVLLAGVLCALLPNHHARKALMLIGPLAGIGLWFATPGPGIYGVYNIAGFLFETYRFDNLSRVWGLIFLIAAFLNGVYALHERSRLADTCALLYAGAGVGAVFAGDFLTLFFYWELTAITSVFLIWGANTAVNFRAGLRYLAIQVFSGVLLLTGAVLYAQAEGSWAFGGVADGVDDLGFLDAETPAGLILLIAIGIKAAFPLLHNWLQDAYPKATVTGAVVLSAFTTKLAVYALARGFAGTEALIWIGAAMAAFPIVFTIMENDLRKVLAYALNNQLGFMVAAIGTGTALGVSGAAAHAFVHVIYKGLLFMSMGAVLYRVGTVKATELGGLWKSMPLTTVFGMIGAATLCAVPLFSGFVAKALTLAAVLKDGPFLAFVILLAASAGMLEHSGFKVPHFAFFGKDSGKRPKEAPWNMLVAMGLASFLCVYLGVNYGALYGLLPFEVDYAPYSFDSVVGQVQLLLAALFAFALLVKLRLYPTEKDLTILDTDWLYRRALDGAARWGAAMALRLQRAIDGLAAAAFRRAGGRLFNLFSPAGGLSRDFPSGLMAIWTAGLLAAVLLVAYFSNV